ncbi:hypothetical protein ABEB36_010242 [Hypothenemus hampei]
MVHEQHLQQQGWSAVIANLEDIVFDFRKRWELFLKVYEDFIADRDTYNNFLLSFEEDKKILQKIPVIDTLLESQKESMDGSKLSETISTSDTEPNKEITLYEWISSSNSKDSLDEMYELCKSNLKKFEKEIIPSLRKQISDTLQSAEKSDKKEIEGLGKRLYDLDDLLRRIKKNVENQSDMAQSFLQNQNSVANVRDTSILPDLCATHVQQMEIMKNCHIKLMDDRNRIVKAKNELSKSLCTRIGWVQNVQDKIWELNSLLMYFHEHLQRLRKHLEVFQQLHLAPLIYVNAVVEVVRRRSFSQMFLMWASDLACQQLTIHNEELTRRKEFSTQFDGHFLNVLFPGMSDVPPPFATEAPLIFDAKLPKILEEDVERLRKQLPEFQENLMLPQMQHIVNFFTGKLRNKEDRMDDSKAVEEKLIQAVSDVGLASNLDKNLLKATGSEPCLVSAPGLPALKDDKGCESETDTEEFEKVGQSPLELTFPQGLSTGAKNTDKIDASTSTEDNLQISKSEHDQLKTTFLNLSALTKSATKDLRTDLDNFKEQFTNDSRWFSKQYVDLGSSWTTLLLEVEKNEKEICEIMKKENNDIQNRYLNDIMKKDNDLTQLQQDKLIMEDRIKETCKQLNLLEEKLSKQNEISTKKVEDLLQQLHEKDLEKEKCLKELSENLKLEHRAELDNIKSRFKLMTMEKSPSLTSLEKEKSSDFSSLPSHTSLLVQMTENFELDKERAVAEERQHWEQLFEERMKEMQQKFELDKVLWSQDLAKQLLEDKEKQIDILREREKNLTLEIIKHKTTIQQLTEYQVDQSKEFEEIEKLKCENQELVDKLNKQKLHIEETGSSLEQSYERSGPNINITSCDIGDAVLAVWDEYYGSFKILQKSTSVWLVHPNQFTELGISVVNGIPNVEWLAGKVVQKDSWESNDDIRLSEEVFFIKLKPTVVSPLIRRNIEKQLAEDSGVVENIEQAAMALEYSDRLEAKKLHSPNPEKLIEELRQKESQFNSEILKYKTIIDELNSQMEKHESDEIAAVVKVRQLQDELARVRNEKVLLESSFSASNEGKLDVSTSPLLLSPPTTDLSKSEIISSKPARLNIDSCKIGDVVLLLWDEFHTNFKVLQESRHTYFLHSDCLEKLGLTIVEGKPNKNYCTGEVVDKEYCQTRKNENRYKVPKGAKFFRVKVKPVSAVQRESKDLSQSAYAAPKVTTLPMYVSQWEGPSKSKESSIIVSESGVTNKCFTEDSGIEEATAAIEHHDR